MGMGLVGGKMSKMAPKECNNEKSLRNTGLKI